MGPSTLSNTHNTKRSETMDKNNVFESTFVNLDLSEFSTGSKPSCQSASAQLIEVKKREALHKQNEDEEEEMIQMRAATRARDALKKLETHKNKDQEGKTNGFYDALLSMHGNDLAGAKKESGNGTTKAQKKVSSLARRIDKSRRLKKGIVKKAKRSKF